MSKCENCIFYYSECSYSEPFCHGTDDNDCNEGRGEAEPPPGPKKVLDKWIRLCYNKCIKGKEMISMVTYEMIREAEDFVVKVWKEDGEKVVEACHRATPFNGNSKEFLTHCTACGGNWGGMFLSGIKELYPEVWAVIPNDMGLFAFSAICETLVLCGVDTTE